MRLEQVSIFELKRKPVPQNEKYITISLKTQEIGFIAMVPGL